jgi:hypothetical protein
MSLKVGTTKHRHQSCPGSVGQAELRLALDGVSGPATGALAATLSPHGTLVSYAAMSLGPMSIRPLEVIFKPLTLRAFGWAIPSLRPKVRQR